MQRKTRKGMSIAECLVAVIIVAVLSAVFVTIFMPLFRSQIVLSGTYIISTETDNYVEAFKIDGWATTDTKYNYYTSHTEDKIDSLNDYFSSEEGDLYFWRTEKNEAYVVDDVTYTKIVYRIYYDNDYTHIDQYRENGTYRYYIECTILDSGTQRSLYCEVYNSSGENVYSMEKAYVIISSSAGSNSGSGSDGSGSGSGSGSNLSTGDYPGLIGDEAVTIKGDINGDGIVDSDDVTLLENYLAGLETLTSEQIESCDFNGDGNVDSNDVDEITQYIASTAITVKGDANGDGVVDSSDVTLLTNYMAGLTTLTSAQIEACDFDGDGDVGLSDVTRIQQYLAGSISSLD